jgi:hypothetical protein
VTDISFDDIELLAMKNAYDELKCLDPEALDRAMTWLRAKFLYEHTKPKIKLPADRAVKP